MSYFNMFCDGCGREVQGYNIVNGMKFCAKCYQEIFGETDKDRKIADLEAKLAESEKSKESYRLQNEHHHLQLMQFYSRLGVEAFGADIHEKALETLMIMKEELEEKNGVRRALSACNHQNDEFADMIKKLVNEKEELKQQLAESENKCRECKHLNKKIELNIKNKLMAENCELQKQLAEKEKEKES